MGKQRKKPQKQHNVSKRMQYCEQCGNENKTSKKAYQCKYCGWWNGVERV